MNGRSNAVSGGGDGKNIKLCKLSFFSNTTVTIPFEDGMTWGDWLASGFAGMSWRIPNFQSEAQTIVEDVRSLLCLSPATGYNIGTDVSGMSEDVVYTYDVMIEGEEYGLVV